VRTALARSEFAADSPTLGEFAVNSIAIERVTPRNRVCERQRTRAISLARALL